MGLFTAQIENVQRFLARQRESGRLRRLDPNPGFVWPAESSLVLEEEVGLELGNPKNGSLYYIMFAAEGLDDISGIFLLGPDLGDLEARSAPFAQVITVTGDYSDEYQCYRDLRDTVYDTRIQGMMIRFMPSRGMIWCRITRQALLQGLSLSDLGGAIYANLIELHRVRAVQVLFVTSSRPEWSALREPGEQTRRIVGAMIKMNEETSYDCSRCEYSDVCNTVVELKKYRRERRENVP